MTDLGQIVFHKKRVDESTRGNPTVGTGPSSDSGLKIRIRMVNSKSWFTFNKDGRLSAGLNTLVRPHRAIAENRSLLPLRFRLADDILNELVTICDRFESLSSQLFEQMQEGEELDGAIRENLKLLGYGE